MEYQDVVQKLSGLLAPIATERGVTVDQTTELTGDLALDSLQVMDLITQVEDEYDISVPLNLLAEVRTVGELAVQVQKCLGSDA
jgi:acyl carrier protein